ncbi:hypothetical protein ES703_10551 [subsurface metagenome]
MPKINRIDIERAGKFIKKEYLPLGPYLINIFNGGIIAITIIGITYILDYLIKLIGFELPFLLQISYWFALPIFGIYSLTSLICLLIDAFKFVKDKVKNE